MKIKVAHFYWDVTLSETLIRWVVQVSTRRHVTIDIPDFYTLAKKVETHKDRVVEQ